MTALYLGGKVSVTAAERRRGPGQAEAPAPAPLKVAGSTGTWKGVAHRDRRAGQGPHPARQGRKTWTVVGGWWPSLKVATAAPFPTMRVLAIGSDARNPQPVTKCRGDALHIIGVDAKKGVGGIVGIPRDSWVPLSTGGNAKINAALVFGGVDGMVKTVERAPAASRSTGTSSPASRASAAWSTRLGGIVFVAARSCKSVDGYRIVKPGTNKLDAKHALALARERKHLPNGDFGRSANQGALIKAGMRHGPQGRAGRPGRTAVEDGSPPEHRPHRRRGAQPVRQPLRATPRPGCPTRSCPGAIGTREGQSVVLLGGAARSIFTDMKNGRLGA